MLPKRSLIVLALAALAACGTPIAAGEGDEPPSDKVFVCKYKSTPGEGESLQTGQNPISVSISTLGPNVFVGAEFADEQGRSLVIAFDVGQAEPDVSECPPPNGGTTTTTSSTTTTSTTSTSTTTTTTPPTGGLFSFDAEPTCPDGTEPTIEITFGDRPDLDGQIGTLTFSTGGSIALEFNANNTVPIQYPDSAGTGPVTMTYTLGAESVTRSTTFPEACTTGTTTTTTTPGATTTTTVPGATTTTTPTPNTFGVPTTTTTPGVTPPPPPVAPPTAPGAPRTPGTPSAPPASPTAPPAAPGAPATPGLPVTL